MTALLVISRQSETLLDSMTQTVQVKLKNLEQEISKVETGVYFPSEIFPLARTKDNKELRQESYAGSSHQHLAELVCPGICLAYKNKQRTQNTYFFLL